MEKSNTQSVKQLLKKHKNDVLGQVKIYPKKVSFQNQNPGEKVYILLRRHLIVNFGWFIRGILAIILPIVILVAYSILTSFPNSFFPPLIVFYNLLSLEAWIVLFLTYLVSLIGYFFVNFLDWYFDIYLVTSERFVHMEFKVLTGKFISEARLANIQDVRENMIGFFATIFDYGDVIITTASEKGNFVFNALPDPTWLRDVLTDLSKIHSSRKRTKYYNNSARIEP